MDNKFMDRVLVMMLVATMDDDEKAQKLIRALGHAAEKHDIPFTTLIEALHDVFEEISEDKKENAES